MNNNANGTGAITSAAEEKKIKWVKLVGAAALLTLGYFLYKKRQTALGSALMTSSLSVLTSEIPQS